MPGIRGQQFLYHITDLNNLEAIFSDGLKSRSLLSTFSDVADSEIITSRRTLRLEEYVPFHCIYVPDEQTENIINALKQKYKPSMFVNNSPNMFPGV